MNAMELKQIREELCRLTDIIDGWSGSAIERDLMLDSLKRIYEEVKFGDLEPANTATQGDAIQTMTTVAPIIPHNLEPREELPTTTEEPSQSEEAQEEVVAEEPTKEDEATFEEEVATEEVVTTEEVSQESEPEEESAPEPEEEEESAPEPQKEIEQRAVTAGLESYDEFPEPTYDDILEVDFDFDDMMFSAPKIETEDELKSESEPKPESKPEPVQEVSAEQTSEEPKEPIAEEPKVEPNAVNTPNEGPITGSASESVQPASEPTNIPQPAPEKMQNSLFSEEDIPIKSRPARRRIMSLYGEPAASEQRTSRKPRRKFDEFDTGEVVFEETPIEGEVRRISATTLSQQSRHRNQRGRVIPRREIVQPTTPEPAPIPTPEPKPLEATKSIEPQSAPKQSITESATPRIEPMEHIEPKSTLADSFRSEQKSVADLLSEQKAQPSQPIIKAKKNSLFESIGINDKFLMTSELFGGKRELFDQTIEALDQMPSLEDCMIYIYDNFQWNGNNEAARLLGDLLWRKYSE